MAALAFPQHAAGAQSSSRPSDDGRPLHGGNGLGGSSSSTGPFGGGLPRGPSPKRATIVAPDGSGGLSAAAVGSLGGSVRRVAFHRSASLRTGQSGQTSPATASLQWRGAASSNGGGASSEADACNMSTYFDRVGEDDAVDFQDPDELAEEVALSDLAFALRAVAPAEFHRLREMYSHNPQTAVELAMNMFRSSEETATGGTDGHSGAAPAELWTAAIEALHSNTGVFYHLMECGLPEDCNVEDD